MPDVTEEAYRRESSGWSLVRVADVALAIFVGVVAALGVFVTAVWALLLFLGV